MSDTSTQRTQNTSDRLVEIGRCVHSLSGSLEAIADALPEGSMQAVELAGVIDGGIPALVELVMAAIADDGGELTDERREQSMARGYQTTILLRRETETKRQVPTSEWKEDPIAFMRRQRAERGDEGQDPSADLANVNEAYRLERAENERLLAAVSAALDLNRQMCTDDEDNDSPGNMQHAILVHALEGGER